MAPGISTLLQIPRPSFDRELQNAMYQPAIPFRSKETEKPSSKEDPSAYLWVNISLADDGDEEEAAKKKNLTSHSIYKFKGGTPEQFCIWRQTMQELFAARGCDNLEEHHAQQLKLYKAALAGNALRWFNDAYTSCAEIDMARVEAPASAAGSRGRAPQIPDPR